MSMRSVCTHAAEAANSERWALAQRRSRPEIPGTVRLMCLHRVLARHAPFLAQPNGEPMYISSPHTISFRCQSRRFVVAFVRCSWADCFILLEIIDCFIQIPTLIIINWALTMLTGADVCVRYYTLDNDDNGEDKNSACVGVGCSCPFRKYRCPCAHTLCGKWSISTNLPAHCLRSLIIIFVNEPFILLSHFIHSLYLSAGLRSRRKPIRLYSTMCPLVRHPHSLNLSRLATFGIFHKSTTSDRPHGK